MCPTCLAPEPSTHHPELIDHSATWQYAKRGTVLQLQSRVRVAEALTANSIKPHYVRKTLLADADREIRPWLSADSRAILYEWCCGEPSLLSSVWRDQGRQAVRLSLPAAYMSSIQSVREIAGSIASHLRRGTAVCIRASLPCTSWSPWQRICGRISPAHARRVAAGRRLSRNMLSLLIAVVKPLDPMP